MKKYSTRGFYTGLVVYNYILLLTILLAWLVNPWFILLMIPNMVATACLAKIANVADTNPKQEGQ